eukprot:6232797-Amphidinium_carterae.2
MSAFKASKTKSTCLLDAPQVCLCGAKATVSAKWLGQPTQLCNADFTKNIGTFRWQVSLCLLAPGYRAWPAAPPAQPQDALLQLQDLSAAQSAS